MLVGFNPFQHGAKVGVFIGCRGWCICMILEFLATLGDACGRRVVQRVVDWVVYLAQFGGQGDGSRSGNDGAGLAILRYAVEKRVCGLVSIFYEFACSTIVVC